MQTKDDREKQRIIDSLPDSRREVGEFLGRFESFRSQGPTSFSDFLLDSRKFPYHCFRDLFDHPNMAQARYDRLVEFYLSVKPVVDGEVELDDRFFQKLCETHLLSNSQFFISSFPEAIFERFLNAQDGIIDRELGRRYSAWVDRRQLLTDAFLEVKSRLDDPDNLNLLRSALASVYR